MLRSTLLALLSLPAQLRAFEYIVPVSTGRINQSVYTTTVALRNESTSAVTCEWSYLERRGGIRLTARDEVRSGQTIVHEDFGSSAGVALGIARATCSGRLTIAARAQISMDGGATFADPGRVFDGAPIAGPVGSDSPTAFIARSDLVIAEVGGKAVSFEITIKKEKHGDPIGHRSFAVAAHGLQLVNLDNVRALAPELWVEVRVEGAGRITAGRVTEDPKYTQIAVRMPPESRARLSQDQGAQEAQTDGSRQMIGADAVRALSLSSFKAAPFEEPVTGLVNMRQRWYDRETGSFVSPDPRGYADSANLYSYCGGDPVNCSDPTGEAGVARPAPRPAIRPVVRPPAPGQRGPVKAPHAPVLPYAPGDWLTLRTAVEAAKEARRGIAGARVFRGRTSDELSPAEQADFLEHQRRLRSDAGYRARWEAMNAGALDLLEELLPVPLPAMAGGGDDGGDDEELGWSVGDPILKLTRSGRVPAWNTQRARFWKNEATKTGAEAEYGSANLARMRRGLAPQRYNFAKGAMESKELSHEPTPQRDGGTAVVPRWPGDHAAHDWFRNTGSTSAVVKNE